jgi:hypothetical protein
VFKNSIRSQLIALCGVAVLIAAQSAGAQTTVTVGTAAELQNAVISANNAGGNRIISVRDGTYTLTDTLYVNASNVTITGLSGARDKVIIQGDAMSATATVKALIRAAGKNFTVSNVTLQKSGNHLLQVAGEQDADGAIIRNVIFRDAFEQMLKVSIDQNNYSITGDNGLIENSLFEYTAGIGPQYYIGGIDVHGGKNWIVRNNTFRNIISPSQTQAEFAIHFWNQSGNALVEKNTIVDCDRGIGFGLDARGNTGGIIRNNMIYHAANKGAFADVAIYLENSPNTQIYNNSIYTEHSYPRSIEYRFAATSGVLIVNNLANKPVGARDGAAGTVGSNVENAAGSWFVNPTQGNLHLAATRSGVVDAGRTVSGLTDDIDGESRPKGAAVDIGADEFGTATTKPNPPSNVTVTP